MNSPDGGCISTDAHLICKATEGVNISLPCQTCGSTTPEGLKEFWCYKREGVNQGAGDWMESQGRVLNAEVLEIREIKAACCVDDEAVKSYGADY